MSDPGFLPEDISYDPVSKDFYLTSVLAKKIIRLSGDGKETQFASSPSQWPIFAVKVDAQHRLLWATEVAVDGFIPAPKKDWGHSALLCYDLRMGVLKKRIEGPSQAELGDLVLDEAGTPIISDGKKGGIYTLVNNKLEKIDQGHFISPQTIAIIPGKERLIVPDYTRGIGILNPGNGAVQWLKNGVGAALPTYGVFVNGWFYYIANSGWNTLNDSGEIKSGMKPTPAHIMRYKLGQDTAPQMK